MTPPCATWKVWLGAEVEGRAERGTRTIFIRELPAGLLSDPESKDWTWLLQHGRRIWFCHEFTNWLAIRAIWRQLSPKGLTEIALEVLPKNYTAVPADLRAVARLYLKVVLPEPLKAGDHICVGPAFHDEAFQVGTGVTVSPQDYLQDRKVI